jgi:3-deoxy-manno-octulosonate cytidylyltransferase (CMP-KDO synthetase)
MNPVVMIPARLASTRFPNKPLADLGGRPMIAHVVARALEADVGPVVVAAEDDPVAAAARDAGAEAVLTGAHHQSGSDRIFEALGTVDPDRRFDTVINVQGDLPTIEARAVRRALDPLAASDACAVATLVAEITDAAEKTDPNVVKAVVSFADGDASSAEGGIGRALYFTRATAPSGDGPLWHHIGLYAYRRAALEAFVALPPSPLERRERLEQLRALEAGMRIDAARVDTVPLGVDTPADLEKAARLLGFAPSS